MLPSEVLDSAILVADSSKLAFLCSGCCVCLYSYLSMEKESLLFTSFQAVCCSYISTRQTLHIAGLSNLVLTLDVLRGYVWPGVSTRSLRISSCDNNDILGLIACTGWGGMIDFFDWREKCLCFAGHDQLGESNMDLTKVRFS